MSDYGFRISKPGIDVKTGADKDMILTSKYALLKNSVCGNGSVVLSSGVRNTSITVSHNLGYIPFIQVFIKLPADIVLLPTDRYLELPQPYAGTATEEDAYYHYSDSNTLTLDLYWWSSSGGNITVYYKYFIYLDKGKL